MKKYISYFKGIALAIIFIVSAKNVQGQACLNFNCPNPTVDMTNILDCQIKITYSLICGGVVMDTFTFIPALGGWASPSHTTGNLPSSWCTQLASGCTLSAVACLNYMLCGIVCSGTVDMAGNCSTLLCCGCNTTTPNGYAMICMDACGNITMTH